MFFWPILGSKTEEEKNQCVCLLDLKAFLSFLPHYVNQLAAAAAPGVEITSKSPFKRNSVKLNNLKFSFVAAFSLQKERKLVVTK